MKTVVFEGVNGSGKTTQAILLDNRMLKIRKPTMRLDSTTAGIIHKSIRKFTREFSEFEGLVPAEALLFAAYLQHQSHSMKMAAAEPQWGPDLCITDRYISSLEVYQGYIKNVDVSDIVRFAIRYFHVPDVTIVLRTDPEVAMNRVIRREQEVERLGEQRRDYFDVNDEQYYITSSAAFANIATTGRCSLGSPVESVNANISPNQVHTQIMHILYKRGIA